MKKSQTSFFNVLKKDNTATLLLYGDIGENSKVDSNTVVSALLSLSNYDQIDLHINSNGGEVFSGIAIYNAIGQSTSHINIYVDGVAASMAAVIALCGKPLYMSKYARLMLHHVSGGAYGSAEELRTAANEIDALEKSLSSIIAQRCKMTPEEVISTYFDGKDHWFTAQEALEKGLIDGIYDAEDIEGLNGDISTEEIYQNVYNNRLQRQSIKPINMNLEKIKKLTSFSNVTTEEEFFSQLKTLEDKANQVTALKDKIAALEEKELESIVNTAIAEKKISAAQKSTYLSLLKSDKENTLNLINQLPKNKVMVNEWIDPQKTPSRFEGKTWNELDKEGLLLNLKSSNLELFKQKFKEEFGVEYK